MCLSAKTETPLELEWQISAVLLSHISLQSFFENENPHFVIFCSLNKRVIGVSKSEVGSRKSK